MTNAKEIVDSLGLTLKLARVPANPLMDVNDSRKMINYCYTFKKDDKEWSSWFSTGCGWVERKKKPSFLGIGIGPVTKKDLDALEGRVTFNPLTNRLEKSGRITLFQDEVLNSYFQIKQPTIFDIIECLMMDASAIHYDTFEDWASDAGYDPDSRKAEEIFYSCRRTAKEFRAFIGAEKFSELQEAEW